VQDAVLQLRAALLAALHEHFRIAAIDVDADQPRDRERHARRMVDSRETAQ